MSDVPPTFELKATGKSGSPKAPPLEAVVQVAGLFEVPLDSEHLSSALTHPSYAHEVPEAEDNQRLEFLGDAVLGLCVSHELIARLGSAKEGKLTRTRSQIVSTKALSAYARRHGVADAMRFGRGAEQGDLSQSDKVLADAVEALIAACYLAGGLPTAQRVCSRIIDSGLGLGAAGARDAKSELQERVQAQGYPPPTYQVRAQRGPAHRTEFEVEVRVASRTLAVGVGRSRRAAEAEAAREALSAEAHLALPSLSDAPEVES
jgi:ribonuclease-3